MESPATRSTTGQAGEDFAVRWLKRHGFRIEARNWRRRTGELDVIAWEGTTLVFVEVKTRRGAAFGSGADAVGFRKQGRMLKAATAFLQRFASRPPVCRFDVLDLDASGPGEPVVRHLPDAFRPGWA